VRASIVGRENIEIPDACQNQNRIPSRFLTAQKEWQKEGVFPEDFVGLAGLNFCKSYNVRGARA
jgi:hypothetical protein